MDPKDLEIKKLRSKISPMENVEFTEKLSEALRSVDLSSYIRNYRGGRFVVISPSELYELCFNSRPNTRNLTEMGRSLQALLWERSALHGGRVFILSEEEYAEAPYRFTP